MIRSLVLAVLLAACSGGSKDPPTTPTTPEAPPAAEVAPMAWAVGTYGGDAEGAGTGTLTVHASEGALYAVWLGEEQARVWIFDEDGEANKLHAWTFSGIGDAPRDAALTVMSETDNVIVFGGNGNPMELLSVRRTDKGGLALSQAAAPSNFLASDLTPIAATRAPKLEDADRAFAADSLARGADAWSATVAMDGALYRRGEYIVGPDAVKSQIAKTLAAIDLRWEPVASGMSPSGTFGFTIGKATWTSRSDKSSGTGSYVTIWELQPDGTPRWTFDTGR